MSSRGATWRGKRRRKKKMPSGQRNRLKDRSDGELVDFPPEKLKYMVDRCRSKVAHKSYGAAYAAKIESEKQHWREFHIYECPICGKWHLTTHPWEK